MSNDKPIYNANPALPKSLNGFKRRASAKVFTDDGYSPPTPEEVDTLIKLMGWSQNQVAKLTGVNFNPKKGSPTVRRWKTTGGEHRQIPYSAWRLLLLSAGVVAIESDLRAID